MCLVPDGDLFEAICAGQRVGGHRPDRDLHRGRASSSTSGAELEADVDRHRDRPEPAAARRHGSSTVDGEPVELPETMAYKGMMLERRAEPGVRARLHERLLDAQVRPHLRVRLPAAQPHGRARLPPVHAARPRPVGRRGAVHRLQLRLRAARDRPVPEAGLEGAVAAVPELRRATSSCCATASSRTARCSSLLPRAERPGPRSRGAVPSTGC